MGLKEKMLNILQKILIRQKAKQEVDRQIKELEDELEVLDKKKKEIIRMIEEIDEEVCN